MMNAAASSAGYVHDRWISQPPSASSSTSPTAVYFSVAGLSSWKRMVGEARRMQAKTRHSALMERDILLRTVSPVKAEMEGDEEYPEYRQLDEMYWNEVEGGGGCSEKSLFLSNYAEFLYRVVHDYRRAEYYYKKAVEAKPADAEALSGYTNFLWVEKKDVVAAEETYLEAIAADPGNNDHGAKYGHFLWKTGAVARVKLAN